MLFKLNSSRLRRLVVTFVITLFAFGSASWQSAQESDDSRTKEMRQMWQNIVKRRPKRPERTARPARRGSTPSRDQVERGEAQTSERRTEEPKPEYKMASPMIPAEGQDIGITVWRLRPSQPNDPSAAIQKIKTKRLKHNPHGADGDIIDLTPERIDLGRPLHEGEMVQLSVEAPPGNFLYVINREEYVSGTKSTYGTPYLIFPTSHTNRGLNRIEPGTLINIPAMSDDPPYFDVERSSQNHVGEEIIFVISASPIAEFDGKADQTEVPKEHFQNVLRWAAETGRIELIKGAGKPQTSDEAEAAKSSASDGTKRLRHNSPTPQMIFRVARKPGQTFIVSIRLGIAP